MACLVAYKRIPPGVTPWLWAVFRSGLASLLADYSLSVQVGGYLVSLPWMGLHELQRKILKRLEGCDREASTLHVLETSDTCLISLLKVI